MYGAAQSFNNHQNVCLFIYLFIYLFVVFTNTCIEDSVVVSVEFVRVGRNHSTITRGQQLSLSLSRTPQAFPQFLFSQNSSLFSPSCQRGGSTIHHSLILVFIDTIANAPYIFKHASVRVCKTNQARLVRSEIAFSGLHS